MIATLVLAASAAALPAFTTAPKSAPGSGGQAQLAAVRVGCHATFDRIVFEARLATPAYRVRYASKVIADGSGNEVSLLGTERLRVVLPGSRAHTLGGAAVLARVLTPRCPNLRQAKLAGDFEGTVSFGLGLRRTAGFRVVRLTAPTRIVVDVAH